MAGVRGPDDFRIIQGQFRHITSAARVVLEQVHFLFHWSENPQDVLYVRCTPVLGIPP